MEDTAMTREELIDELELLRRRVAELEADARPERIASAQHVSIGVAQRLNNLLTPIVGYAQLGEKSAASDGLLRRYFQEIEDAASSAAVFTGQLLAFSARQLRSPRLIDLNDLLRRDEAILRLALGQRIQLEMTLEPGLWPVKVDPNHFEQVLMNLVANCRDAMPDGGSLQIRTYNLPALEAEKSAALSGGDFAVTTIQDTGSGLPEEAEAHLFEPFFSTRARWKHLGLGLPVCYGIMSQNDGWMDVESKPGLGTTVRLYLPRAE